MRGSVVAAIAASVLATTSNAITLQKRENPRVASLGIHRKDVADPVARDQARRLRLRKRAGTVSETLDNYEVRLYHSIVARQS